MPRKMRLALVVITLVVFAILTTIHAQQNTSPDQCTALVEQAMLEVGNNCSDMDRNSTCYGYNRVNATFSVEVDEDFFSAPADRAGLTELQTITTSPLDLESAEWGVALMNVQANVPNTLPGQAVTFVLLGDVKIENEVSPENVLAPVDPIDVTVNAGAPANVRSGPSTFNNVVTAVEDGAIIKADGLDEFGGWVRVSIGDTLGWISRSIVRGDGIDTLPVITEDSFTPMQAFYFTTGIGNTQCQDAPDVLFIQSPDGIRVDLTVNGAEINLGSTIALVNTESSYADASGNEELIGVFTNTLLGKNLPADAKCNVSEMVMLEGTAIMNDNVSLLPPGHGIRTVSCGDGDNAFTTPWRGLRRLSQEELNDKFKIIEQLDSVLDNDVDIPTDKEIDDAIDEYFTKPDPTATGTVEVTATPTPTGEFNPPPPPTIPPETTEEP